MRPSKCIIASLSVLLINGFASSSIACDCNQILQHWTDTISRVDKSALESFINRHQLDTVAQANSSFKQEFGSGGGGLDVDVFGIVSVGGNGGGESGSTVSSNSKLSELHLLDGQNHLSQSAYNAFYSQTASPISLAAYTRCLQYQNPPSTSASLVGDLSPLNSSIPGSGQFGLVVSYDRKNQYEPQNAIVSSVQVPPHYRAKLLRAKQNESVDNFSVPNGGARMIQIIRDSAASATITVQCGKLPMISLNVPEYLPMKPIEHPAPIASNPDVQVHAVTNGWTSTGMTIQPGQWVVIDFVSGNWTVAKQDPVGHPRVGPEGYNPVLNGIGTLTAKTSSGTFYVGRHFKYQQTGVQSPLELAMFDNIGPGTGGYSDNDGTLHLKVQVFDRDPDVPESLI